MERMTHATGLFALRFAVVAAALGLAALGCKRGEAAMSFQLTSPKFSNNGEIPAVYTCEGRNVSPPLSWNDVPAKAKSLALIVDDPDAPDPKAPKRVFVHWVLYNLPTSARSLPEGMTSDALPAGAKDGTNDFQKTGYGGPCPPIGRHRYFFKLYALDATLDGLSGPTKADLERAMQGHVVAEADLVGTYEKKQK
jgi:Raf kinase inhibitor-like YbhB/YbcL family protein